MESIYQSKDVILDSGGYEAYATSGFPTPATWSIDSYHEVLREVESHPGLIAVSFDYANPQVSLIQQLDRAIALRDAYRGIEWTFLAKPISNQAPYLDVRALCEVAGRLAEFRAIGVVEEDLGGSLASRALAVATLRLGLREAGLRHPIHVFGCLNPWVVPLYFLCGADVFDGLDWLRWTLSPAGPRHFIETAFRQNLLEETVSDVGMMSSIRNLEWLEEYGSRLSKVYSSQSLDSLGLPKEIVESISQIAFRALVQNEAGRT